MNLGFCSSQVLASPPHAMTEGVRATWLNRKARLERPHRTSNVASGDPTRVYIAEISDRWYHSSMAEWYHRSEISAIYRVLSPPGDI